MRNIFVSYSHRLDQKDVDDFRKKFADDRMVFSDKSLENQDLSHLQDDTIKNNYIKPKLRNCSVTIILIGQETGGRWWVDWEIYYSLLKLNNNDRCGLLGILLPNKQHFIPQRLLDNMHMGLIIEMPRDKRTLDNAIEQAYQKRTNIPDLSRPLRQRNSYLR